MSNYTPPTEVIRHAVTFPRERLGEPRPIKVEAFDRWLEQVKSEAREEGKRARPLPTRDEIADELSGWLIWSGYYQTRVDIDEARDMADMVLALLKGQDT